MFKGGIFVGQFDFGHDESFMDKDVKIGFVTAWFLQDLIDMDIMPIFAVGY